MKFFSDKVIDKLKQQYGSEPIIVCSVHWDTIFTVSNFNNSTTLTDAEVETAINYGKAKNTFNFYGTKDILNESGNLLIPGKILDISEVETAVNFEGNNQTSSVTVTVDDSDGSILGILSTARIHLRPAYVYLTFEGFSVTDMILIFEGVIVSDFTWNEKDLTVTLNFLSRVEEKEVGFSPEQGYIKDLPLEMIGRPWPFGFGDIVKYPGLRINYTPTAVTTDPIGLHDYSLDVELERLRAVKASAQGIAEFYFKAALQAYFSDLPDIGDQLTDQGNDALKIVQQIILDTLNLKQILEEQVLWQQGLDIQGGQTGKLHCITDVPVKLEGNFQLGELFIQGKLKPQPGKVGILTINQIIHPTPGTTTWGNDFFPPQKDGFKFVNAGTKVQFLGKYPCRYLINTLGGKVTGVYAYRTFEGLRRLAPVPKKYWKAISVRTVPSGVITTVPTFTALVVETIQPLSTLRNQFWDDDLYVSYISNIGPALKDILSFLIHHYTTYRIDSYSFNSQVPNVNCSFVLPDQKDVMAVIKEICFQNNLAIWLSEGIFYFSYLPAQIGARSIIGVSNIIQDSVQISISPTENIITKMKGSWRFNYEYDIKNYVAIRYNDNIYGVHSLDVDYYCFNDPSAVQASMQFWVYRKGNVWKRLKLSLPLSYLSVDIFDNVLLTKEVVDKYKLGEIKEGSYLFAAVIGMKYNPSEYTVEVELELPIYVGSKKFSPAYWMNLAQGIPFWQIDDKYQLTETPQQYAFYQRGFSIAHAIEGARLQAEFFDALSQLSTQNTSNGLPSPNPVEGDPKTSGVDNYAIADVGRNIQRYSPQRVNFPQQSQQFAIADEPSWKYTYGEYPVNITSADEGNSFPGFVTAHKQENVYEATIYPQGLIEDKKTRKIVAAVMQITSNKDEVIPKNTWAIFIKNKSKEDGTESYSFQVPIWLN